MASGVYFYTNDFGDKIEQELRCGGTNWRPVQGAVLKMWAQKQLLKFERI